MGQHKSADVHLRVDNLRRDGTSGPDPAEEMLLSPLAELELDDFDRMHHKADRRTRPAHRVPRAQNAGLAAARVVERRSCRVRSTPIHRKGRDEH
jgi:hypothetical protein